VAQTAQRPMSAATQMPSAGRALWAALRGRGYSARVVLVCRVSSTLRSACRRRKLADGSMTTYLRDPSG
jgi:hypothetical protein